MSKIFLALALTLIIGGCSSISKSKVSSAKLVAMTKSSSTAKVLEVQATGEAKNYTFAVTVSSPDTGCDLAERGGRANRYADWWEVITPEGELLYRRVLLHSHVDEQPFQRTGGSVAIEPQQKVIVRVHMSPDGYSTQAQEGTIESGFSAVGLSEEFAVDLESVEPLPQNCAF